MRLKMNALTAVVVRKSWAHLQAIQMFLHDRPSAETADDSYTLLARVLDDSDARGLWIELESAQDLPDASADRPALMIPWQEVLATIVSNDLPERLRSQSSDSETLKLDLATLKL
jgi:hypothetical protein